MSDRALIDTSGRVYSYDPSEPRKFDLANEALQTLADGRLGLLSTQILVEFATVVALKIPQPLSREVVDREAQVWAAARLEHVPVVLSEDFADGCEIEGVRFVYPFALPNG